METETAETGTAETDTGMETERRRDGGGGGDGDGEKCSPPATGGKIGCGPRDLSGHKDISAIRASAAPCVRLLPPALRRSEVGAEQQVKA